MGTRPLLELMATMLPGGLETAFGRKDLCILATRVAIDVLEYFGVRARPQPCRAIVYNRQFSEHVQNDWRELDISQFREDGSYSVGMGYGAPPGGRSGWDGHLVVVAEEWFADYSISQAERPHKNVHTGVAVIGNYSGAECWRIENSHGTVIEYQFTDDRRYRGTPDWKDARRRDISAGLIRAICRIRAMRA